MRKHPAVRVAHQRAQLAGVVAANTHARVALAHAEGPTNRGGPALLRTSGGACNVGGAASLHTIHKGPRVPPFGTGGGEQPHLAAGQVQRFAREEHERNEQRRRDFERLEKATARARKEQEKKRKLLQEIGDVDLCTKKVADHAGKEAFVLAYMETENGTKKVLLQTGDAEPPRPFRRFWVWHMRGLGRILDSQAGFFEKVEKFHPWATLYWIPYAPAKNRPGLRIRMLPPKSFWTAGGQQIHWNPLELLSIPLEKVIVSLRELLQNQETQDLLEQRRVLEQELVETDDTKLVWGLAPPRQKDCFPALALPIRPLSQNSTKLPVPLPRATMLSGMSHPQRATDSAGTRARKVHLNSLAASCRSFSSCASLSRVVQSEHQLSACWAISLWKAG